MLFSQKKLLNFNYVKIGQIFTGYKTYFEQNGKFQFWLKYTSQENLNEKTEFNWAILTIGILQ